MSKYYSAKPSYKASQNFLTSARTIRRLLNYTTIQPGDSVVEIGAGKGHITRELLKRCGSVYAYEIDPELIAGLRSSLTPNPSLKLIPGDFLAAKLPLEPYKVFSNIPFCITTPIMKKLIQAHNKPLAMWLVMECNAARRLIGGGCLTSLEILPFYHAKIAHFFRREDFHPMPGVDAVLVQFIFKSIPDVSPEQKKDYSAFLTRCMKYGLYSSRSPLTKKQISTALTMARLPQIERSGGILYVQWLCLFRCFLQLGKR